jgi:hypothetical protein
MIVGQANGFPKAGKGQVFDAVLLAATRHAAHPPRDYFNSLTWDGKERLTGCSPFTSRPCCRMTTTRRTASALISKTSAPAYGRRRRPRLPARLQTRSPAAADQSARLE